MESFIVSLLLIALATALPNKNGASLNPAHPKTDNQREFAAPTIVNPVHGSDTIKTASFTSVESFCASHPFARGCEAGDEVHLPEVEVDHSPERDEDRDEDFDNLPSLLTVAFFCSTHPSAIGCPQIVSSTVSGEIGDINTFPEVMVRFCILHPSSYGCPKLGIVREPPSLPLPLSLPPPVVALDNENAKKLVSERLTESFAVDIQPYEYRVLAEFFNSGAKSTAGVENLMGTEASSGNQYGEETTGITGRSVGDVPVSETNDLLYDQDGLPDASLQMMIQVFESAKVVRPKATLSLPPPVDAIFASGRYAWQKTTGTSRAELAMRLNRGKMKPLPSVKQVLGPLAL